MANPINIEDLRKKASGLIMTNPLLSTEDRKKWLGYLPEISKEEDLVRIIEIFEESREEVKNLLIEHAKKDPEGKLLDKLKEAQKKAMKKVSGRVHEKEGVVAEKDLERELEEVNS
jgi:hypothetical protein